MSAKDACKYVKFIKKYTDCDPGQLNIMINQSQGLVVLYIQRRKLFRFCFTELPDIIDNRKKLKTFFAAWAVEKGLI